MFKVALRRSTRLRTLDTVNGRSRPPQVRTLLGFGEAMVADWQAAGLVKASVLKPVFTTIEQALVIRIMGTLAAADIKTLREVVGDVIG